MPTFGKGRRNRRKYERKPGRLQGEIIRPCRPSVYCTVLNLSVAGALLETPEPEWLPPVFKLVIPAGNFQTFCEVRHREERRCGVAFVAEPAIDTLIENEIDPEERQLTAHEELRLRLAAPGH